MLSYVYKKLINNIQNFILLKYIVYISIEELTMNEIVNIPFENLLSRSVNKLSSQISGAARNINNLPKTVVNEIDGEFILFVEFKSLPNVNFSVNCISCKNNTIYLENNFIEVTNKFNGEEVVKENILDVLSFNPGTSAYIGVSVFIILNSIIKHKQNLVFRFFSPDMTGEIVLADENIKRFVAVNTSKNEKFTIKDTLSKENVSEIIQMIIKKIESVKSPDQATIYDYVHDNKGVQIQIIEKNLIKIKITSGRTSLTINVNNKVNGNKIKIVYPKLKPINKKKLKKSTPPISSEKLVGGRAYGDLSAITLMQQAIAAQEHSMSEETMTDIGDMIRETYFRDSPSVAHISGTTSSQSEIDELRVPRVHAPNTHYLFEQANDGEEDFDEEDDDWEEDDNE